MGLIDRVLHTIREQFMDNIKHDGLVCPVCNRYAKMYRRKLNKTMAKGLIWLYRFREKNGPHEYVSFAKMPNELLRSNQLSTNRWWGLIERLPNDDPKTKHSGMWRLTPKGANFVNGYIKVPSHVWHYNSIALKHDGDMISIDDALGEDFHYGEMMEESKAWV